MNIFSYIAVVTGYICSYSSNVSKSNIHDLQIKSSKWCSYLETNFWSFTSWKSVDWQQNGNGSIHHSYKDTVPIPIPSDECLHMYLGSNHHHLPHCLPTAIIPRTATIIHVYNSYCMVMCSLRVTYFKVLKFFITLRSASAVAPSSPILVQL